MASVLKAAEYPAWLAQEERKAERVAVTWEATVRSLKSGDAACRILDFTHLGCRFRSEEPPSMGSHVSVIVPGFAEVAGWIAWRADGQAGVDFAHPLPDAVLQEVVRRNGVLTH